jgi:hypothetical protein
VITRFDGQTRSRKSFSAIEVWRPQAIWKRANRPQTAGTFTPCLWKWALFTEAGSALGIITLSTHATVTGNGFRALGPRVSLFIRPNFRALDYGLGALESLIDWVRSYDLYQIIHASHRSEDRVAAKRLREAEFIYTGCVTEDSTTTRPILAHQMIRVL